MRRPWSDADVAEMRRLWALGTPVPAIAAAVGHSVGSIHGKAFKLRLKGIRRPTRPWTAGEVGRLKAMWDAGQTYKQVARALGRTPWAVLRMARRQGYQARRNRPLPTDVREQVLALMRAGRSCQEAARRLPVSRTTAKRWREAAGIPKTTAEEHRRNTVRGIKAADISPALARSLKRMDRLAAEGWPYGTRTADARIMDLLEAAAAPLTLAAIGRATEVSLANPYLSARLCRMRERQWIVRVTMCPVSYVLSDHVRALRAEARGERVED